MRRLIVAPLWVILGELPPNFYVSQTLLHCAHTNELGHDGGDLFVICRLPCITQLDFVVHKLNLSAIFSKGLGRSSGLKPVSPLFLLVTRQI